MSEMPSRLCILDDDPAYLQDLKAEFSGNYEIDLVTSVPAFWEIFAPQRFALVVVDMRLEKDKEGLEVLRKLQAADPFQAVVVATAYADTETYLEAMQAGALLYVDKARHSAAVMAMLFDAVIQQGRLRRQQAATIRALERIEPVEIIGSSDAIRALRNDAERLSRHVEAATIIVGEPGSGRELVARSIHLKRQAGLLKPLITFQAQELPAADLIKILIGQDIGSAGRRGLLGDAHGTGLIVRGAEKLPAEVLTLIIESWARRWFRPAGASGQHPFESSLYFVCESASIVESALQRFRRDKIRVPALRDRKEDITLLALYFIDTMKGRGREQPTGLGPDAITALLAQEWPGNVAELKSALEYASLRASVEKAQAICEHHLPTLRPQARQTIDADSARRWDLEFQEARVQMALVNDAMTQLATTNKTKLASFLHVNTPTTLSRRIERGFVHYPNLVNDFPRVASAFSIAESHAG